MSPSSSARLLLILIVLQAGLVIGSVFALSSVRELYTRAVEPMMTTARPGELTTFTDGVARQAHFATTLLWRFTWMLAGSAGALLAWRMGRR